MISREQALNFAHDWIDSWNSHDLTKVLDHYENDFEMSSPFIIQLSDSKTGTLKGKHKIGEYWKNALEKYPNLNFKLIEVFSSINTIVIYYHSIHDKLAAEFFMLNEKGKVYKAIGHYN